MTAIEWSSRWRGVVFTEHGVRADFRSPEHAASTKPDYYLNGRYHDNCEEAMQYERDIRGVGPTVYVPPRKPEIVPDTTGAERY